MFGIGIQELVLIAFVAVLVVGPERMPELARQAGRMVRSLTKMANQAKADLREELGPEYADLRLQDLDPRAIVRKHINEAMADLESEELATRSGSGTNGPGTSGSGTNGSETAGPGSTEPVRPPFDHEAT